MASQVVKSIKKFKKSLTTLLFKLFQKFAEQYFWTHSKISPSTKTRQKYSTKNLQANTTDEHPHERMETSSTTTTKLANWIQQYIKMITQWSSGAYTKDARMFNIHKLLFYTTLTNQIKKSYNHLNRYKKALDILEYTHTHTHTYTHKMEWYSGLKNKNEILLSVTKCVDPEGIMLRKISQRKISIIWFHLCVESEKQNKWKQ